MLLLTRENLTEEEIAEAFRVWINWLMGFISGAIICAKPVRPLLPQLRKELREKLSSDDRKELAQACVKIKALLDHVQIEEEDKATG